MGVELCGLLMAGTVASVDPNSVQITFERLSYAQSLHVNNSIEKWYSVSADDKSSMKE